MERDFVKSLISVVIPTYNRARDLERALNSVLAQTYPHWEALVVDNHSSDNTDNVVTHFDDSRISLLKIHNNGVIAASRNLGIKHAQGEYIAFLDSDDWWLARKLEVSLKYLDRGADVVYHDLYMVTKRGQRLLWQKGRTRVLNSPIFEDLLVNGNALQTSGVVARDSILRKIGGLSEDVTLIGWEDYDAWLRAASITEKFKRIPKTLGYYWCGGGNDSTIDRSVKSYHYFGDRFQERYANALAASRTVVNPWWIDYSLGRAYYRLGINAMAESYLRRQQWRQLPPLFALKNLWMLLMIKLVHGAKR